MQTEIARHRPMIRFIGLSDRGLRCHQVLRKDKVKGRVRKTVTPRVSYSFRQSKSFKTVLVSSIREGIECSFRREHCLIVICVEVAPDHNAFNLCTLSRQIRPRRLHPWSAGIMRTRESLIMWRESTRPSSKELIDCATLTDSVEQRRK